MREFCRRRGEALHRPWWVLVPSGALRSLLGEMADLLLTGQRVIPHVALQRNYPFAYPALLPALQACVAPRAVASAA